MLTKFKILDTHYGVSINLLEKPMLSDALLSLVYADQPNGIVKTTNRYDWGWALVYEKYIRVVRLRKAKTGDKIVLTEQVCYGSIYGPLKLSSGTTLTVAGRNSTDDGIITVETINQSCSFGHRVTAYEMWDHQYEILSN